MFSFKNTYIYLHWPKLWGMPVHTWHTPSSATTTETNRNSRHVAHPSGHPSWIHGSHPCSPSSRGLCSDHCPHLEHPLGAAPSPPRSLPSPPGAVPSPTRAHLAGAAVPPCPECLSWCCLEPRCLLGSRVWGRTCCRRVTGR
jgi:hypothetical protein